MQIIIYIYTITPGVTDIIQLSSGKPVVLYAGTSIWTGLNNSFNGYLVDEDYFSSAGSGSNSAESTSSVSTFGDTLFVGNEFILFQA